MLESTASSMLESTASSKPPCSTASSSTAQSRGLELGKEREGQTQELEALKWERVKVTLVACLLYNQIAFLLGGSPLVEPMNANEWLPSQWVAPGVTVLALRLIVQWGVAFPLLMRRGLSDRDNCKALMRICQLTIVMPLTIAIGAGDGSVAAAWHASWTLQYLGAVVSGFGGAAIQIFAKVWLTQYWDATGQAEKGNAIIGLAVGGLTIFNTGLIAILVDNLGLQSGMLVMTALQLFVSLGPALLLSECGLLQAPPVKAALRVKAAGSAAPAAGADGSDYHEMAAHGSSEAPDAAVSIDIRENGDANPEGPRGAVTVCSSEFVLAGTLTFLFLFTGVGLKALLTPIFSAAFGISYIEAAWTACIALIPFAVVSSVLPLFAKRFAVTKLFVATRVLCAVTYACFPVVVAKSSLWVFLAVTALAGALLGGEVSLYSLLALEVFGADKFKEGMSRLAVVRGIGIGLGPVVGYYFYLGNQSQGSAAYSPFFYLNAVLSAAAAVAALLLARAQQKQHAPSSDEKERKKEEQAGV